MSLSFMSAGRPPTLWWLLMVCDGPLDAGGLDDVGVERALDEPGDLAGVVRLGLEDAAASSSKTAMNSLPMILRFCLGVGDAGELGEEAVAGVDGDEVEAELVAHGRAATLANSFLRRTPLLTKMQVRRSPMARWTRTAATEESTPPERPQMAWPSPTWARMRATVDSMKCSGVQSGVAPQMSKRKFEELRAVAGVGDLGVELHGPDAACRRWRCRRGRWRSGGEVEAGGEGFGLVAVAHPDVEGAGQAAEERRFGDRTVDFGVAVLARGGGFDVAAEVVDDELQAVADAEDGDAEGEERGVGGGGVGVVDGAGAAGEDDAAGRERADLVEGRGAGKDDGEDVELADAAGDELGVLRAEVEDDDCLGVHEGIVNGGEPGWIECIMPTA